ncbi:MAG: AMP-binding protein, partial [Antricoccus sp.]
MYAARHAQKTPEKPAIIMASTGEVLTYGQYEARSNQIAHAYVELGLKQFDRIALIFPNTLEYST